MANANKPNVLYVDDEPINLDVFRFTFNRSFNVLIAKSGFDGLKIVEQNNKLNLVISDMKMPKMNGLEFVNRAKHINNNLPFIILSAYEKTAEIDEAIRNKVIYDYIMKPFNKDELEQCILNVLKGKPDFV